MAEAIKAAKPVPRPRRLDVASNAYFGVLAKWKGVRVVVNASRKSYAIQMRGEDGKWQTVDAVPHGSLLSQALMECPELQPATRLLPEWPTDAVTALRHGTLPLTAGQIRSARRRT